MLHPAKKLRRNANIGGNLFFGDTVDQGGVPFAKVMETVFGGKAQVINQTLLIGYQRVFGNDAKKNVQTAGFWCIIFPGLFLIR